MPYLAATVSVMDYLADPTGVTDSTAAFDAAALAVSNAGGGVVAIPAGTFKITPVSSSSAGIVFNNGASGYYGVRLVGAGQNATTLTRASNGPIITMSGPASDTTGVTHCRYCTLENLTLSGNGLTGALLQTYYADTLAFHDVHFENSNDVGQDVAEYWDSRYYNCLWDTCGSTTPNTVAPALWLRNSAATTGFGYSTGTVNNLYFFGCRWEQSKSGSIRIERGLGANTGQPYSIYFVSSKIETVNVNGGASMFVDTTARDIRVENMHLYQGGFYTGYSTAQDGITFGPQFGALRDVLIFNSSAVACIANGVTLNAPLANSYVVAESVRGSYTGGATPTGAHLAFGTSTGEFRVVDCQADAGTQFGGTPQTNASELNLTSGTANGTLGINNSTAVTGNTNADLELVEATAASQAFGTRVTGDTFNRYLMLPDGTMKWGSGTGAIDTSLARASAGLLFAGSNFEVSGTLKSDGIFAAVAGITTAGSAPAITPTFASGTAAQLSDVTRDYQVYFTVGTAGTITLAIGPTSTPATTLINAQTATAGELVSFRLPAGWFVKVTLATATITQHAIGC